MIIVGDSNSVFIEMVGFSNIAQPGYRVKDVLAQLHHLEAANILIVGVGVNDSATITDIESHNKIEPNIDEFKVDYQELLNIAKRKFNQVIVMGLISSTEEEVELEDASIKYKNESIKKFNEVIRDLCLDNEIEFVDLLPYFLGKEKELSVDHIHPNEAGKEIILDAILKQL